MSIKAVGKFGTVTLELDENIEKRMRAGGGDFEKQCEEIALHLQSFAGCLSLVYLLPESLCKSAYKNMIMAFQTALFRKVREIPTILAHALCIQLSPRG